MTGTEYKSVGVIPYFKDLKRKPAGRVLQLPSTKLPFLTSLDTVNLRD